jgi:hypothetical protein
VCAVQRADTGTSRQICINRPGRRSSPVLSGYEQRSRHIQGGTGLVMLAWMLNMFRNTVANIGVIACNLG